MTTLSTSTLPNWASSLPDLDPLEQAPLQAPRLLVHIPSTGAMWGTSDFAWLPLALRLVVDRVVLTRDDVIEVWWTGERTLAQIVPFGSLMDWWRAQGGRVQSRKRRG